MVKEVIKLLNVNKSCGPDEINPRMLLELAEQISAPLALIMNKALHNGTIPKDWKEANVSPIYKKGARNNAENYDMLQNNGNHCERSHHESCCFKKVNFTQAIRILIR